MKVDLVGRSKILEQEPKMAAVDDKLKKTSNSEEKKNSKRVVNFERNFAQKSSS